MTPQKRLNSMKRNLSNILACFAAALLIFMTLLVLYQVFTRYVLGSPAAFTEELVRYALIWTSFISAAYAFVHRGHMSLVFLRDKLPPGSRRAFIIGADAVVLVFAVLILVIGGTMLAFDSRHNLSALLGISRGLVYAIVPIAGMAIAFAQALNIWADVIGDEEYSSNKTIAKTDGVDR